MDRFFNRHESLQARRLHTAIADNESIELPGIVLTEILLGFSSKTEAERVENLMTAFPMTAELSRRDYQQAAWIYRRCRQSGKTIRSTADCVIAAQCLRDGLPLLSKDRDVQFVAEYFPLQCIAQYQ